MLEDPLKKAEDIISKGITNIELISYFKRSNQQSPVFLSEINRNWAEISPLVKAELIYDNEPIKSYIFFIDKLENYFYEVYQEKIDNLKDEIWRRKREKTKIIELTENITPEEGEEDYDQKLMKCLEYARESIGLLDSMEIEKEGYNDIIGDLQERMKEDPIYKFLFYIRNDKEIIYNKRTEDNGSFRKKMINYLNDCYQDLGIRVYKELVRGKFIKEYSPAKNYYITELGLYVDDILKKMNWENEDSYERTPEELAQEEEFKKLQALLGF